MSNLLSYLNKEMIGFLGWIWTILAFAVGVFSILESQDDATRKIVVSLIMAVPGLAAGLWSTDRLGKRKSIGFAAVGILVVITLIILSTVLGGN